jgi:hypothetical protein
MYFINLFWSKYSFFLYVYNKINVTKDQISFNPTLFCNAWNMGSFLLRLGKGRWLSSGTPVSSTNKTDRNYIAEILLKVALNIITPAITWSGI